MDEQVLVQSVEDNDTVSEEAQVAGGSGGGSDDRAAAEAERLEISHVQRMWRSKESYCWTQLENVSWWHGDQGPGTGMEECRRATGIGCDVVEFGQLQIL